MRKRRGFFIKSTVTAIFEYVPPGTPPPLQTTSFTTTTTTSTTGTPTTTGITTNPPTSGQVSTTTGTAGSTSPGSTSSSTSSTTGIGSSNTSTSTSTTGNDTASSTSSTGDLVVPPAPTFSTPPTILTSITQVLGSFYGTLRELNATPLAIVATRTITSIGATIGVIATLASVMSFSPLGAGDISTIPFRIWGWLSALFRSERKKWGVVYNSKTKEPLDPAYVVLKNAQGETVATSITDIDGRFGFLVPRGIYKMEANKTNYVFPSKLGKNEDELYSDLYYGGDIHIEKNGDIITHNIPLDPIGDDWNAKAKSDQHLMTYYTTRSKMIARVSTAIFVIGAITSTLAFIVSQSTYNSVILSLYLVIFILRELGFRPRGYGAVVNQAGYGLPYAIIRFYSPTTNIEITHKVTDATGRYYCLIQNGTYFATIDRKNDDGSYTKVLETAPFNVDKGWVGEEWSV